MEHLVHKLSQVGLVALGSALGGLLRWGVGVLLPRLVGGSFPWATFFINITGCLFLGWFYTIMTQRSGTALADNLRLFLAVGFTGAYTTFSTFEYETNELLRDGDGLKGMTYVFGSVFLGLVAVRLGIHLAQTK